MSKAKRGLGKRAKGLNITKAMRSRISDDLTPPPRIEVPTLDKRFDPKALAERIWMSFVGSDGEEGFEVRFRLRDTREFALRGDKEGFGTIQPLEPFTEVHEKLLETYYRDIVRIEVFAGDRGMTFNDYDDFLEWLEL